MAFINLLSLRAFQRFPLFRPVFANRHNTAGAEQHASMQSHDGARHHQEAGHRLVCLRKAMLVHQAVGSE